MIKLLLVVSVLTNVALLSHLKFFYYQLKKRNNRMYYAIQDVKAMIENLGKD
jgi:hypothetical protein